MRTATMRLGHPLPEKLAGYLVIIRMSLITLFLLGINTRVLRGLGLPDAMSSPWGSALVWTIFLVAIALLAREFAEKYHRAAARRAAHRLLSPLRQLQF